MQAFLPNWERQLNRDIINAHMDKCKRFKIYVDGQIFSNLYLVKCDDEKLVLIQKGDKYVA